MDYYWSFTEILSATSEDRKSSLSLAEIEARALSVSSEFAVSLGNGEFIHGLGRRSYKHPAYKALQDCLPRLKAAVARNERAMEETFSRQCATEEAEKEARRVHNNGLVEAYEARDFETLSKMLEVQAESFEDLLKALRVKAKFAGKQTDLGSRHDSSCREIATFRFTDESGWYIDFKEEVALWDGRD